MKGHPVSEIIRYCRIAYPAHTQVFLPIRLSNQFHALVQSVFLIFHLCSGVDFLALCSCSFHTQLVPFIRNTSLSTLLCLANESSRQKAIVSFWIPKQLQALEAKLRLTTGLIIWTMSDTAPYCGITGDMLRVFKVIQETGDLLMHLSLLCEA